MYQEYYQLTDDPFRLNSDENSACLHHEFKRTLENIADAISEGAVLIYVTGKTGIGKTMLLKSLAEAQDDLTVLLRTNSRQFNHQGLTDLLMDPDGYSSAEQSGWLSAFENIMDKQDHSVTSVISIDDAHDLTDDSLAQLGQAVKLIDARAYRCCFVLAGNNKIESPQEGFPVHLIKTIQLNAIRKNETAYYVRQRLKVVGSDGAIQFDEQIWDYLYQLSEGVPRRINRICNRLLLNGMFDEKRHFDKDDIITVARQLDKEGLLEITPDKATELDLVGINPENVSIRPVLNLKAFYQAYQTTSIKTAQPTPEKTVVPPVLNDTVLLNTRVIPEVIEPVKPVAPEEPLALFPEETDYQHGVEPEEEIRHWMWPVLFLLILTGLIVFAGLMIYRFIEADFVNERTVVVEKVRQSDNDSTPSTTPVEQTLSSNNKPPVDEVSGIKELELPIATPPSPGKSSTEQPANTRQSSVILSASLYKELLQDNQWQKNYKPAVLLPSELNQCTTSGDDIYCITRTRQSHSKDILYSYQTGAMIQNFQDDGTFSIMYRSSITRTENPEPGKIDPVSSLKVPVDTKERQMQCEFITGSMIKCTENRMVSIYTRLLNK